MRTAFVRKNVPYYAVIVGTLFAASNLQPQETRSKPTVVTVERADGRTTYKIDSKPTKDLLYALNQVADKSGVDHPVIVFLDPRLPVDEIWNVNGVAGKARLTNLRFFIFFRENGKMTEIKWTPFVPFTTSPPGG